MKLTSDLHLHTYLSPCASRDATPAAYIERAARQGMTTLCFTDHYWDPLACKPMLWGSDVFELREQFPRQSAVRVLLGCETECIGGGRIGITPQTAARLDLVLLSTGHFRAKGLTIPEDVTTLPQVRAFGAGATLNKSVFRQHLPRRIAQNLGIRQYSCDFELYGQAKCQPIKLLRT